VISLTALADERCGGDDWAFADRGAFKARKDAVAWQSILRAEAVLPGLRDHVEVYEAAAPQTLRAFTGNPRGTIYGFAATPDQSLLAGLAQETPIPNLLLAGAWTFPGCGQATVLRSGNMAAHKILAAGTAPR